MEVEEATLGGVVSSAALLLCSKSSVNEGTLLRELVVTLLGADEVFGTLLNEREVCFGISAEARLL